jgi:eukaryotic-like serine/threonine-protein kinase
MSAESRCGACGNLLPEGPFDGLCPVCLLRQGLVAEVRDSGPCMSSSFASTRALTTLDKAIGGLPLVLLHDSDLPDGTGPLVQPASPEMPAPCHRSGRLQLLGEIARGGMGAVLKGRDPDLGRDLAVKVLLESHRDKPDLVRRFVEEAQIGGQLQHPGIVPIYELGAFADHRPYFAMKLVKGRTLSSLLDERSDRVHDRPRFLSIFEAVCQTIAYTHARGVIHRDLKPSNIMVGSFGEVQVMDWGLAKVLPKSGVADDISAGKARERETVIATARSGGKPESDLSRAGSVMGTPSYMAPEQARGEVDRLDERCDVFALGSIRCEILTGEPAFTGRSSGEIQRNASRGELNSAIDRLAASALDFELIALTKDCLAPELEDRPRHASEVAARINAYQTAVQERLRQAEIARAEEKARAEEATKRARVERDRVRLTVALAASILALVILGGSGAAWLFQQRHARLAGVETTLARIQAVRDQAAADGADLARWREALAAADQALGSIGDLAASAPGRRLTALRARITEDQKQGERDRLLIDELNKIRTSVAKISIDPCTADVDTRFAQAFKSYDMDLETTPVEGAIAQLKARPEGFVREVVGSLDHWLIFRRHLIQDGPEKERQRLRLQRLLELVKCLDTDPERNRLRAMLEESDLKSHRPALTTMAGQPKFIEFGPSTALLLARNLMAAGDEKGAVEALQAAVVRYPGDTYINFELATWLSNAQPPQPDEAIRYYTAARALRPETGWDLARILEERGRTDEAEGLLRDLSRTDPDYLLNVFSLWELLRKHHQVNEALTVREQMLIQFREQTGRKPNDALIHWKVARYYWLIDDLPRAIAAYRETGAIDRKSAECRCELGRLLFQEGDLLGAITAYREAIGIAPSVGSYRAQLAEALGLSGDHKSEIAELGEAIRLKDSRSLEAPPVLGGCVDFTFNLKSSNLGGNIYELHTSLGGALAESGDVPGAIAAFSEAIRLGGMRQLALGNALRLKGNLPGAIASYHDEIRLNPKNSIEARFALGVTLAESGDVPAAIAAFREAIQRERQHGIRFRLLRAIIMAQQPEAAIAALERVREQARDDGTIVRSIDLATAQYGQFSKLGVPIPRTFISFGPALWWYGLPSHYYERRLFAASAATWFAGFAADSNLADDMNSQNRYNAARSATLAAAGKGLDAPPLDEKAKARWRHQALDWLRADLAYWAKQAEKGSPEAKALVNKTLQHWKAEIDLNCVRDEKELINLAEPERIEWRALWTDVAVLLKRAEAL